ncbi:hypothetical protein BCR35DRAFT_300957 [Leucosporidium creatinivorum]|uniref:Uncharacterized protein n=1 Tax=Leucosporidium creatinivorum TaxID=106004 RepID=A0A1Y2G0Z5_9BASI|nr:hypothetical protein BCR35DRAFT_300957 [Leucosporidium creatinivorum]
MAPKPRGLKASKKATPAFDPSAAAAPVASTSDEKSVERTMPLDQDHLSISDLFELRLTVLDELLANGDADKQEEARGMLRGILHGAEVLLELLPEDYQDLDPNDDDEETKKLAALGLANDMAQSFLFYLQGFALHELASILPPPEPLAHSAVSSAQGAKKRKVDLSEPTDPAVWLDEATEKFEAALEIVNEDEGTLWTLMVIGGLVRSNAERGALAIKRGDTETADDCMGKGHESYLDGTTLDSIGSYGHSSFDTAEFLVEYGDPITAFLGGISALIAFVEAADPLDGDQRLGILSQVNEVLAEQTEHLEGELKKNDNFGKDGKLQEQGKKWQFEISAVVADGLLAQFVMLEDSVEAEFRPDEDEDAENEEDGEGEVTPLPVDAESVKGAREAGQKAIDALRRSINLSAELPDAKQVKTLQLAQYKKLEEAYLVYSALFNPDDVEGTKKVEDELAQVRKDGGLEVEEAGEKTEEEEGEEKN